MAVAKMNVGRFFFIDFPYSRSEILLSFPHLMRESVGKKSGWKVLPFIVLLKQN